MENVGKGVTGVYLLYCTANSKGYIGSCWNLLGISRRWSNHLSSLRNGNHSNAKLQRAWNKYGEGSFQFLMLNYLPRNKDVCLKVEQSYFDNNEYWKDLYNIVRVAGGCGGHSKEAKVLMSEKREKKSFE